MIMGTLRTSTDVRVLTTAVAPALLAGVIEFVLSALFAASVATVVCGLSYLCLPSRCVFFFCFSSCSCLRGEEEGTLFLPVVVVGLPLSLLYCVFSL